MPLPMHPQPSETELIESTILTTELRSRVIRYLAAPEDYPNGEETAHYLLQELMAVCLRAEREKLQLMYNIRQYRKLFKKWVGIIKQCQ